MEKNKTMKGTVAAICASVLAQIQQEDVDC